MDKSSQASKAAKLLAVKVWNLTHSGMERSEFEQTVAEIAQKELADLLEKAQAVNDPDLKRFMALQEALEPWKAGE